MNVFDLLTLVLGLSLFLFGMTLMSETLKKSAGRRLKTVLGRLTESRWRGFWLGVIITAIVQSSSATTVMIVGFVNSGAMQLAQAVSVVIGANVGTTVTSWLTALSGIGKGAAVSSALQWLKPSSFTPIIAVVGMLYYMTSKSNEKKNVGAILLGFSVLMVGMQTMSDAVSGMADNDAFRSLLLRFENPILGVLAGLVITAIVQSSSASIGILQSFTATGAITFGNAVPIIMGQNIGTCVTALVSSAGTSKNAKRTAMVHLLFNVLGSALCLAVFYLLSSFFDIKLFDGSIDTWGIAVVHTLFNVISAIALFPLSRLIEKMAVSLVREIRSEDRFSALDDRLVQTPSVALSVCHDAVCDMSSISQSAFENACLLLDKYNSDAAERILRREVLTDEYEDRLGTYLVKISKTSILDKEKTELNKLLHTIGDLERIADHAVNITESAKELKDKQIEISADLRSEICVLVLAVKKIVQMSVEIIKGEDGDILSQVEPLEQVVDDLKNEIKSREIIRLQNNETTKEMGFILADVLNDLERIADHCSNIAGYRMSVDAHRNLRAYRETDKDFLRLYNRFRYEYKL